MTDILLNQYEADALLALKKIASNDDYIDLPDLGGQIDIMFHCEDNREKFVLNYTKHSINLSKRNHHLRARKVVGLARLDLDGPPHRNPNDEEIGPRHLHLYREGFGLKWAFEIPANIFTNLDNSFQALHDFMRYCNVETMPKIRKGLYT